MNGKQYDRDYATLKVASELLLDKNLVWSSDLEGLRIPLARMLRNAASEDMHDVNALAIADYITSDEFQLGEL